MSPPRRVAITLQLEVTTDRDPEEYGDHLAQFLAGEINGQAAYPPLSGLESPDATCRVTDTATVWLRK